MNDKKKKKYVVPEAEIIEFNKVDDIITTSNNGDGGWEAGVREGWW